MHFHSRYSPDSITTISRIIAVARRESLDFLLLTDHETTAGARELAIARVRRPGAGGPPGRRISDRSRRPDCGVPRRGNCLADAGEFPCRGARQGGMVLLPHPFVGHADPEMLAGRRDLVEVFNGRAGRAANQSAMSLRRVWQAGLLGVRRPPRVQPGKDRRDGGKPGPAQRLSPPAPSRRPAAGPPSPATSSCPKSSKSSRPET